jgi:hypothetical protein
MGQICREKDGALRAPSFYIDSSRSLSLYKLDCVPPSGSFSFRVLRKEAAYPSRELATTRNATTRNTRNYNDRGSASACASVSMESWRSTHPKCKDGARSALSFSLSDSAAFTPPTRLIPSCRPICPNPGCFKKYCPICPYVPKYCPICPKPAKNGG